jgi:hypothetical protein
MEAIGHGGSGGNSQERRFFHLRRRVAGAEKLGWR